MTTHTVGDFAKLLDDFIVAAARFINLAVVPGNTSILRAPINTPRYDMISVSYVRSDLKKAF